MTIITVSLEFALIAQPIPIPLLKLIAGLSGRKVWSAHGVRIEATTINIKTLQGSGFELQWEDAAHVLSDIAQLESLATQLEPVPEPRTVYLPRKTLFGFQRRAV